MISIHAPRTGSDTVSRHRTSQNVYFNPRSPHGERLLVTASRVGGFSDFNPRSPHGERRAFSPLPHVAVPISIHAPRTGSDLQQNSLDFLQGISIHAPRTGSDRAGRAVRIGADDFNPRSPHGERLERYAPICSSSNFNPRSPHGERLKIFRKFFAFFPFQSTLPARGATEL